MTAAEIFTALLRVSAFALAFGAGIPLLFALGMRAMTGDPIHDENGVLVGDTEASPQMKMLGWIVYGVLALIIVTAIVFIAKDSLNHYFGWNLFPGISGKH